MISAQACWGFAIVFVVKLYDLDLTKNLSVTCMEINKTMPEYYPKTPYYSAQESVEIGDILLVPRHAMVIIAKNSTSDTIGEGNYGGRVHYGHHFSYEAIDISINYILRIIPPENASSDCYCVNFQGMPAKEAMSMKRLIGPTPMSLDLLPAPAPSPLVRIRLLPVPWRRPSSGG